MMTSKQVRKMASIENSTLYTANELNSRVDIYQPKPTLLEDGTRHLVYSKQCSRWSNVSIVSFRNSQEDKTEMRRTVSYRIVMRYREDLLTTESLLRYRGQFLRLSAPPINLKNKFYLIDCYAEEKAVEIADG